jgi:hypothetical protein
MTLTQQLPPTLRLALTHAGQTTHFGGHGSYSVKGNDSLAETERKDAEKFTRQ